MTDPTSRETTGRVATLSTDLLVLAVDTQPRELHEADVASIFKRQSDSLVNGALWGAAVGTGLSLYGANRCANDFSCRDWGVGGVAAAAAIGAGAGAGVDALIRRRLVVYERPAITGRILVSPIVDRASGILVSMRW